MPYNIEKGFISKLLQTKDFSAVKDSQIKENYFNGEDKNAFLFIVDTFKTSGEVPTERVFRRKFPSYSLDTVENESGEDVVGTEENIKYWCEELRKKSRHNQIAMSVEGISDLLQKFNTEDAYQKIKSTVALIEGEFTETTDIDITQDAEDRILAYKERKMNRGMRGLATGFSYLDTILKGLEKSTLTTLIANTGIGKAITVDTPVLTENGYVSMRDIKVGTKVCSSSGKFYNVSAVYPQGKLPVYRVHFEDGTYIDCCKDHLWKFKTTDDVVRKKDWRVKTLEQILSDHPIKRGKSYNINIPVLLPVQFSGKQLPVDPYVLGCKSESKFIPDIYLNSSPEDRLSLIQGLIDTDGSIDSKGSISYFTESAKLKDAFVYLIRSLGKRCYVHHYTRGTKNLPEYKVTVSAKDESLYRSSHRAKQWGNRVVPKRINHYDHLKIVEVEALDYSEEMQCITVDSPDHTFICGDFIVTHNTWFEVIVGSYCMLNSCRVLQFVTEMSEEVMRDRYEAALYAKCCGEFDYSKFKSGTLDSNTEARYFNFLRNDLPHLEPLYIVTATSPLGVAASIDKYKPDIVLIDSTYLMEDDQSAKDDWLRVAHITRDLKKLAKFSKVPILINTQADKNTSKKTGPELESIMYTQAIGQDSDNVLALYRDEVMLNDKEMGIKVLKQREGTLGKLVVNWDFDTMNFSDIYVDREEDRRVLDTTIQLE